MKNAWAAIVAFFHKLQVAQYLKPVWKGALKEAVQLGGDALQQELDAKISAQAAAAGPKLAELVAGLPARFSGIVAKVPCLPDAWRQKAQDAVAPAVAHLQDQLAAAGATGPAALQAAFDGAFDGFQADLIARIAAL